MIADLKRKTKVQYHTVCKMATRHVGEVIEVMTGTISHQFYNNQGLLQIYLNYCIIVYAISQNYIKHTLCIVYNVMKRQGVFENIFNQYMIVYIISEMIWMYC